MNRVSPKLPESGVKKRTILDAVREAKLPNKNNHIKLQKSEPKKKKMVPRLPHGSLFNLTYQADKVRWIGTLTVIVGGVQVVFTDSCQGVFGLLMYLDKQYRKHLKKLLGVNTNGQ